jgi:hypothetical protein
MDYPETEPWRMRWEQVSDRLNRGTSSILIEPQTLVRIVFLFRFLTMSVKCLCYSYGVEWEVREFMDAKLQSHTQRHECLCVRLFCVCVVLCVDSGLATGWSLVQVVLPFVKKWLRNWWRGHGPTKGCRAIDEWMNDWMTLPISCKKLL